MCFSCTEIIEALNNICYRGMLYFILIRPLIDICTPYSPPPIFVLYGCIIEQVNVAAVTIILMPMFQSVHL